MGKIVRFPPPEHRSRWTRVSAYAPPDNRTPHGPSRKNGRWFPAALVGLPLAAFTAVLLMPGGGNPPAAEAAASALSGDRERARFGLCTGPVRHTCVIDGDTIWYQGAKIRIADINTPEVSDPACPAEAALGRRATQRMQALLNAGPFTLEPTPDGRSEDSYGRKLMVVTRGGESLGAVLVAEGLAERWTGRRREWC